MNPLKALSVFFLCVLLVNAVVAQKDKSKRKSPPVEVSNVVGNAIVTINYSQPAKKGRTIFGELVPYGKVWRTGANESSWIEVSEDVKVEGKTLTAGKYGLFTIPRENEWIIIFNTAYDGWGAYQYKESEDVLRIIAVPSSTDETEMFTINVEDDGRVSMAWDKTKVDFLIE